MAIKISSEPPSKIKKKVRLERSEVLCLPVVDFFFFSYQRKAHYFCLSYHQISCKAEQEKCTARRISGQKNCPKREIWTFVLLIVVCWTQHRAAHHFLWPFSSPLQLYIQVVAVNSIFQAQPENVQTWLMPLQKTVLVDFHNMQTTYKYDIINICKEMYIHDM